MAIVKRKLFVHIIQGACCPIDVTAVSFRDSHYFAF